MRLSPKPAPCLPQFKSLLVHGPYHPSAPIHLCLSIPPSESAILFSPSRDFLLQGLRSYNDPWLNAYSGTGAVADTSSGVTILYPPSPTQLVAILAMLRVHDVSSPSVPIAPRVTLDRVPTLLVLHEPSMYFPPGREEYTVSSYLLLITHALSTIEFLSRSSLSSSSLVVFDTQLDHLKLPVLRTPPNTFNERDNSEDSPKPESVLFFVEKYFQLLGTFQSREQAESDGQTFVWRRSGSTGASEFFSFILKPGSSLHPSFLLALDCAFGGLFLVFAWSAYLTSGTIHFFFLMGIELALWASVKWFVLELRTLVPKDEAAQKKDQ